LEYRGEPRLGERVMVKLTLPSIKGAGKTISVLLYDRALKV
jgi:hypothetical protein